MVALNFCNTRVAFALPGCYRVQLIPGGKQLGLLAGKIELVAVAHIEVGARNGTACTRWWFGSFFFEKQEPERIEPLKGCRHVA